MNYNPPTVYPSVREEHYSKTPPFDSKCLHPRCPFHNAPLQSLLQNPPPECPDSQSLCPCYKRSSLPHHSCRQNHRLGPPRLCSSLGKGLNCWSRFAGH